jgi:hypothetical protein
MFSERQIRHLLEICEKRVRKPLETLRERLLRDRNSASVIWELLLFYIFVRRYRAVVHEPAEKMPDFLVRLTWRRRVSFEAACVTSPSRAELSRSSEFTVWLYRELLKEGIDASGADIAMHPLDSERAQIPAKHRWGELRKQISWKTFVDELRQQGAASWLCAEGDIRLDYRLGKGRFTTTRPLPPKMPTDITKHPVYRELKSKAVNISRWPQRLKQRPIVVAILISENGSEFADHQGLHDYTVRRAIFSALLDHEQLSDLDRINILRQRLMFRPDGAHVSCKRLRVAGSGLISGVIVVRLTPNALNATSGGRLVAKGEWYPNPHSSRPLSPKEMDEIRSLDFNQIEYGPGRESWHDTARGSLKVRNIRLGGIVEYRSGNGGIEVRIPTTDILAILAGEKTAQDVFANYGDGPANPLQIFQQALASERSLESVEVIETDPLTRAQPQISFRFGKGGGAVIARAKDRQDGSDAGAVDHAAGSEG